MTALENTTDRLRILGGLAADLNRAADVRGSLFGVLRRVIDTMGLESGWIVLADPEVREPHAGAGFIVAAHHNLPPALAIEREPAWAGVCHCERRCRRGELGAAYNEMKCPRLDRLRAELGRGATHASASLDASGRSLGVINVAAADWSPLDPTALDVLTQVGRRIGAAIERGRAYEQLLSRRVEEQSALLELSREMLAHRSIDELISSVLRAARDVLDADACALLLTGRDPRYLQFSGSVGWQRDPAAAGRRVRSDRRCSVTLAMDRQKPVVIENLQDSTLGTWAASWDRAEGFCSQAVVPLTTGTRAIGALVLNTRTPRQFDEGGTRFLQLVAHQAALALESAGLREREAARTRLDAELALAHDIQQLMLPDPTLDVLGWDLASTYRAAQAVGGDFYDVLADYRNPRRMGLLIGDVAGKSISGALLMAMSLGAIRMAARRTNDPAEALIAANARIRKQIQADRFVSAFFGWLDTDTGDFVYACAGHNPPLIHRAGAAAAQELDSSGVVLGIVEDPEITSRRIRLAPGDTLVLFTDGVTEALDADRELFGEARLEAAIVRAPDGPAKIVLDRIVNDVNVFTGAAPQSDDLTIMVVHRLTRPI